MERRMIAKLKKEIQKLHELIDTIQEECSHPASVVTKIAKSNTGNYDSSEDSYWYDCSCGLCEKTWKEDQ